MATKENLMGLGVPHHLAARLGRTPVLATAQGTTIADGRISGGEEYDIAVATGTGGIVLRSPASVGGYLLGDEIWVANLTASSISLFIRNGVSVVVDGTSVSGSLGVSVGTCQICIAKPITASTWVIIGSVLSN